MSANNKRSGVSLSHHILPTSGTMIGICMTLIGLVKLNENRGGMSHVDEYAALSALVFLASAVTSYLSLRYEDNEALSRRLIASGDLRESANTVREAGFDPFMAAAIAEKQQWVADLAAAGVFGGIDKGARWQEYADRLLAARDGGSGDGKQA